MRTQVTKIQAKLPSIVIYLLVLAILAFLLALMVVAEEPVNHATHRFAIG
jgi:hypothetical protein